MNFDWRKHFTRWGKPTEKSTSMELRMYCSMLEEENEKHKADLESQKKQIEFLRCALLQHSAPYAINHEKSVEDCFYKRMDKARKDYEDWKYMATGERKDMGWGY